NHSLCQAPLITLDCIKGSLQSDTAIRHSRVHTSPKISQVLESRGDSCDAFVVERAHFSTVGNVVNEGTDLVWLQAFEVLALAIENAHVRPEKLVGGADKKIAIERSDVNQAMRTVVNCVDECHRPNTMGKAYNFLHIINRANRVRGVAYRNQPRFRVDLLGQVIHIERAIFLVNIDKTDRNTTFFESAPGGHVGIMVKISEYDFVSRTQFVPDGPAQSEGQRSHVRTKDDFVRITAQKIGHRGASLCNHRVGAAARRTCSAGIGI